jgi:elongation factor P--(R)-beta-lysine ligase
MKMPHAADVDLGSSGNFRPTAGWEALRLRAELLRTVREFFHSRGFLEVETPILSADTVVDRHLDPLVLDDGGRRFYLQTSPEFCMKRLLAAGAGAIYQITRVFRREELGRLHNPEFTMVEWYRPGDGLAEGMQLLSDLGEAMLGRGPAELVSYQEAFRRHVGVDPHTADADALIQAARAAGIDAPASLSSADRDGWLDLLLVERVQPHLGIERPTIVYDYPASQSALAQVRVGPPPVAERFELYASGIELANGYHELTDADELRRRIAQANELRRQDDKSALPEENRLLAAMDAGLPESTGVALGFDRVVMLAAGAKSLAEVMAFPIDRA